ncbi:DNA polymerase-3 subunit epsilon [Alkalicoccobacillus murimartini]|uniref:DNA polymerase-3 subunit epsilon n=2 Tax=Alkalicoccobacillus murimartini TaxID=171685 RepID=A0ABT9YGX2_9BACI|nr:DNA polymerase-3 subunit epsilon [Alkalicoccobacillus murimartini]
MNNMIQLVKQLSTKLSPGIYTSSQQQSAANQLAHVREIQRQLKQHDVLDHSLSTLPFVVFDLETSGFNPDTGDSILSIGAIKMKGADLIEESTFYSTVQPKKQPSEEILALTGLTNEELNASPPLIDVLSSFYQFMGDATLVAHHASHEKRFMAHATWQTLRLTFQHRLVDTSFLTRVVAPDQELITLDECCSFYKIETSNRHHAMSDAILAAKLWRANLQKAEELGFHTLRDVYVHLAKGK